MNAVRAARLKSAARQTAESRRAVLEYLTCLAESGEPATIAGAAALGISKTHYKRRTNDLLAEGVLVRECMGGRRRYIIVATGKSTGWGGHKHPFADLATRQPKKRKPSQRPAPQATLAPAPEAPVSNLMSILPLRGHNWQPRTCQFVTGPIVRHVGAEHCGKPVVEGKSYCEEHVALCYRVVAAPIYADPLRR